MKRNIVVTIGIILGVLVTSCNSEPALLDLEITVSSEVYAGTPVVFTIKGDADFLTFYSGLEGSLYSEYPDALAVNVGLLRDTTTFEYTYVLNETVTATFIASSYGDWGEESKVEQFNIDLDVVDKRTGITYFAVKTGGLFGKLYEGVIDGGNSTINVTVDQGTSITAMTTFITPESPLAELYLNSAPFENKSQVDYSGNNVVFEVRAADGTTQEWMVLITE